MMEPPLLNPNEASRLCPVLTDEDVPYLRENLLIETVKAAFGQSRGGRKPKQSDEAWEWINSEDREHPFSFDHCCIACGVNPEKLLEHLHFYRRKLTGKP